MDILRYVTPAVHRLCPTPGPGGLVGLAFSHLTGVDTTNVVHVTRKHDVMEVLERDADFSVRIYDQKMTETTGAFILGMPDLERYLPDLRVVQSAVRREDAGLVRRIAREETERALSSLRHRGHLDAVKELAEHVSIRFVQRYYGIPFVDPAHLLSLFQRTAAYTFVFWSDPAMQNDAIDAATELKRILADVIQKRRSSGDVHDGDVMGRFLGGAEKFVDGDTGISRSIAGLAAGNLNAPIGLFLHSVDKLLSLDDETQARTSRLAKGSLGGSAEDASAFLDHVVEAQRFYVYPTSSYRYTERDTTLAEGTPRERHIRQGTTVVTWQLLAAFDDDAFEDPFAFVPGRPRWLYQNYGHGRHRCLGEHVGQVLIEEMARGLFALPRLRRAAGKAGTLQILPVNKGAYATSFELEFDAS